MPSLTSHINSRYVDAANRLRSGSHLRRRIVVYVESYDDISFWRDVLSEFQTPDREFQVMLPSRTSLSRGKKQAMANLLGESLGECMIACVDADYDYLMQGHTPYSQQLLSNRYIFHTYVYAIENFQCYAPSLHDVCTMATLNDRPSIDFEAYLQRYSEAVYDLFVWTVWLYRRQMYRDFPLNTFLNLIGFHPVDVFHPDRDFADLRHQCNRRVAHMQQRYPEARADFKQLKAELATLGVLPQNTISSSRDTTSSRTSSSPFWIPSALSCAASASARSRTSAAGTASKPRTSWPATSTASSASTRCCAATRGSSPRRSFSASAPISSTFSTASPPRRPLHPKVLAQRPASAVGRTGCLAPALVLSCS
jgi:hypothetical protein